LTDKYLALDLVRRYGGKGQASAVEPFLKDAQVCVTITNAADGQPQVRDLALVTLIELSGQDPKQFGFERVTKGARNTLNPRLIGFRTNSQRAAAFEKWETWRKAQNQGSENRPDAGPNTSNSIGASSAITNKR